MQMNILAFLARRGQKFLPWQRAAGENVDHFSSHQRIISLIIPVDLLISYYFIAKRGFWVEKMKSPKMTFFSLEPKKRATKISFFFVKIGGIYTPYTCRVI